MEMHFIRSALYLNNVPVNQSTQYHHYKSFLHTVISSTRMEKAAPYEVEGYWFEKGAELDTNSTSFKERSNLFKDDNGDYTANARLAGFLYHDLVSSISLQIVNDFELKDINYL